MTRRLSRGALALVLLLGIMAGRAAACRKKEMPSHRPSAVPSPAHWITPLMTPPPPRPTPTMWKGVTRAPQLPE